MDKGLFLIGVCLLFSFLSIRISSKVKIPVLLLFVLLGILSGSEGIGGIYFDDNNLTYFTSTLALAVILFTGALETKISTIKKVLVPSASLATFGIIITTFLTGIVAKIFLDFSYPEAFLFGAAVSSTDAASVFSTLKTTKVKIDTKVRSILEVESGSNDPMAYGLIILFIGLIKSQNISNASIMSSVFSFLLQVVIGGVLGFLIGFVISIGLKKNKIKSLEAIVILLLATLFLSFSITQIIGGNGFLAIYITGLVIANTKFQLKKTATHFFGTFSWIMQIIMFIILGLLVFPSNLKDIWLVGIIISLIMIFVIRPIAVFLSLIFIRKKSNEKFFISWAGLKGAVPIVFAVYIVIEKIPKADTIFNLIFFVVVFSVLIQGVFLEKMAVFFHVEDKSPSKKTKISFEELETFEDIIRKVTVDEVLEGKEIIETDLSKDCLVVGIKRDKEYIIPNANTILNLDDVLMLIKKNEV
ncbi:MAG: potassium/proton antiporter [Sebaldella sp.]|nr:potassium/proton antiporter [Sebaldella sp.]